MKTETPDGGYTSVGMVKDPDGACFFEIAIRAGYATTISRLRDPETLEAFAEELRRGAQTLREQQAKESKK